MTTGWFSDPYGRHEARWMSSGRPTSLVRDGVVERSDPVPVDEPPPPVVHNAAMTPAPVVSRTHPPITDDRRSRTESPLGMSETNPSPSKWRGRYGRRRQVGLVLLAVGVGGLFFGNRVVTQESSQTVRTAPFVPTSTDLAAPSNGGTRVPSPCPASTEQNAPSYELALSPRSANTSFTVYPHSLIGVYQGPYGHQRVTAELSDRASTCVLQSASLGAVASDTYSLEKPGTLFVYFVGRADTVGVVKIVVTTARPPSTLPGWTLFFTGVLLCIAGGVLVYRRRLGPPADLLRADDAARSAFEPDAMQRAAWDTALDQTAGQY